MEVSKFDEVISIWSSKVIIIRDANTIIEHAKICYKKCADFEEMARKDNEETFPIIISRYCLLSR